MSIAETKKYYWLKLKDTFFQNKRIKKLRRMEEGPTQILIYLKMQLIAMKNGGLLEYAGLEPTFAEELALDLDEDAEAIAALLVYLEQSGLAEPRDKGYYLPEVMENTGSETTAAERMRKSRRQQSEQCCTGDEQCCTEIEIEKETETESEIQPELYPEKELHTGADIHREYVAAGTAASSPAGVKKAPKENYGSFGWVKLSNEEYSMLIQDLGFENTMRCINYVDEAAQSNGNKNRWRDWNLVVRKCHREGWGLIRGKNKDPGEQIVTFAELKKQLMEE